MPKFVLLLRADGPLHNDPSASEMQAILQRYRDWGQKVKSIAKDKLKGGEGRVLKRGGTVTDGPYVETKEVVGGFYVIEARDYDEAVRMTKDHPHLEYGGSIEIRQVDPV